MGEGTYGVVFHAVERETGVHVAVKELRWSQIAAPGSADDLRLREQLAAGQGRIPNAFVHETALLQKCAHDNVLKVLDIVVSSTSWTTDAPPAVNAKGDASPKPKAESANGSVSGAPVATGAPAASLAASPAASASARETCAPALAAIEAVPAALAPQAKASALEPSADAAAPAAPIGLEADQPSSMASCAARLFVFIVTEVAEGDASALLQERRRLGLGVPSESEVKSVMFDLLSALSHVHSLNVLHRDIKPSNLLCFRDGKIKLCDFGLALDASTSVAAKLASTVAGSNVPAGSSAQVAVARSSREKVSALWYRAPELLFGTRVYTNAIDLWGVGCVLAELLLGEPLFPGTSEASQIKAITYLLGGAHESIYPGVSNLPVVRRFGLVERLFRWHPYSYLRERVSESLLSEQGFDLLNLLLTYNPRYRITAKKALEHPWFDSVQAARKISAANDGVPSLTAPLLSRKRKASEMADAMDESRVTKRARVAEE